MALHTFEVGYHLPETPNTIKTPRILTNTADSAVDYLKNEMLKVEKLVVRYVVQLPDPIPTYCQCCGQKTGETQPPFRDVPKGMLERDKHLWRTV